MKILLTNDDGIDSPFLRPLAVTLSESHKVIVAAPAYEQSWIGKAMSRRSLVEMKPVSDFPTEAYSLTGTPGDCVNIALAHLTDERPDLVVSGINIGHNAGLSFITSSGTIGAALEASLHNLPAIAASMYLEPTLFEAACDRQNALPEPLERHLSLATKILNSFVATFLETHRPKYGEVHSLNFPSQGLEKAKIVRSPVARTLNHSLFKRQGDQFSFHYQPLETMEDDHPHTDRKVIFNNNISHTLLDFSSLDRRSY